MGDSTIRATNSAPPPKQTATGAQQERPWKMYDDFQVVVPFRPKFATHPVDILCVSTKRGSGAPAHPSGVRGRCRGSVRAQ
jgi:hypothetical protein